MWGLILGLLQVPCRGSTVQVCRFPEIPLVCPHLCGVCSSSTTQTSTTSVTIQACSNGILDHPDCILRLPSKSETSSFCQYTEAQLLCPSVCGTCDNITRTSTSSATTRTLTKTTTTSSSLSTTTYMSSTSSSLLKCNGRQDAEFCARQRPAVCTSVELQTIYLTECPIFCGVCS